MSSGYKVTGILIIGYGSLVRGDDAAGFLAACQLQHYFQNDPDVEVLPARQLTPEMAEFIAESSFVLFMDASSRDQPGEIRQAQVQPQAGRNGFTHHLTPASLVAAAQNLYGDAPPAMQITLAGSSFELADQLSRSAKLRLPDFIRQAQDIVGSQRLLLDLPTACLLVE